MTKFRGRVRERREHVGRLAARVVLVGTAASLIGSVIVGVGAAEAPSALDAVTGASTFSLLGTTETVEGTPCTRSARACVDLDSHSAWLLRDGAVVRGPVEFMDGDASNPTPRGTFSVEWKAERWTSREYGVPMPYSVFFAPGGIAFHEGGQDTPSAGCVKLTNEDAVEFFDFLQVGDEVQVT